LLLYLYQWYYCTCSDL